MSDAQRPDRDADGEQRALARRAVRWRLRRRTLHLPRRPLLMGIVNVTPDSFSDGGRFFRTEDAVRHALDLVEQGADLLDIGGESTRPYSDPVSADEELHRVIPVIRQLAPVCPVPISVDTSKAMVAGEAIEAGAEVVNDVTALTGDPDMLSVVVRSEVGVCAMHMQGTPQTMQDNPHYEDVVMEVRDYLIERRDALMQAGVDRDRIALDPGIGFGKTHRHNLTLLAGSRRLLETGCPVLVGPSRKGFIGKVIGDPDADRTAGTIGVALALAAQGIQILRVHDVAAVRHALMLFEATGGLSAL